MKFILVASALSALVGPALSLPLLVRDATSTTVATATSTSTSASGTQSPTDDEIASLAPDLGWTAGIDPDGTGNCAGAVNSTTTGKPIQVPCSCPPSDAVYIAALQANVHAGKAVNNTAVSLDFPTGDSVDDKLARINAAAVTLQNLVGVGKGCPIASTTFSAQAQQLRSGASSSSASSSSSTASSSSDTTTASASTATSSSSTASSTSSTDVSGTSTSSASESTSTSGSSLSDSLIESLAPNLGWKSGVNPDGTGNCDGAVNSTTTGKPIQVPCSCPPSDDVYFAALVANVHAGLAVNNTVVALTYPTSESVDDQLARINAASVTLQNLEGPGKGCPISSTTLGAQAKALCSGSSSSVSTSTSTASSSSSTASATASSSSSSSSSSVSSSSESSTSSTDSPSTTTSSTAGSAATSQSSLSDSLIESLAPSLGWQSGVHPDGTGNCDGAVNGTNGKPIQVPCSCPPDQGVFFAALVANVHAGHAINNTVVALTYPTSLSVDDQLARINAASATLQNLMGVGKGCPISSTTLGIQANALRASLSSTGSNSNGGG